VKHHCLFFRVVIKARRVRAPVQMSYVFKPIMILLFPSVAFARLHYLLNFRVFLY